jgi:type II secretory pathway component PulF
MVRAGEASGNLDVVLTRVADYLQKQASLKSKVVSALTYPCIMMSVGLLVVIFLMSYVVPQITQVLLERNQALPLPTEILVSISSFMKASGGSSSFGWSGSSSKVLATDAARPVRYVPARAPPWPAFLEAGDLALHDDLLTPPEGGLPAPDV